MCGSCHNVARSLRTKKVSKLLEKNLWGLDVGHVATARQHEQARVGQELDKLLAVAERNRILGAVEHQNPLLDRVELRPKIVRAQALEHGLFGSHLDSKRGQLAGPLGMGKIARDRTCKAGQAKRLCARRPPSVAVIAAR